MSTPVDKNAPLDLTTGLPALPEGYRWLIEPSSSLDYPLTVNLQVQTRARWARRWETLEWGLARTTVDDVQNTARSCVDKHVRRSGSQPDLSRWLGAYPPKNLTEAPAAESVSPRYGVVTLDTRVDGQVVRWSADAGLHPDGTVYTNFIRAVYVDDERVSFRARHALAEFPVEVQPPAHIAAALLAVVGMVSA